MSESVLFAITLFLRILSSYFSRVPNICIASNRRPSLVLTSYVSLSTIQGCNLLRLLAVQRKLLSICLRLDHKSSRRVLHC